MRAHAKNSHKRQVLNGPPRVLAQGVHAYLRDDRVEVVDVADDCLVGVRADGDEGAPTQWVHPRQLTRRPVSPVAPAFCAATVLVTGHALERWRTVAGGDQIPSDLLAALQCATLLPAALVASLTARRMRAVRDSYYYAQDVPGLIVVARERPRQHGPSYRVPTVLRLTPAQHEVVGGFVAGRNRRRG